MLIHVSRLWEYIKIRQGTKRNEHQEHAKEKAKVPNPVNNKGLLTRICIHVLFVPETDQQIGGKTYTLPANKHHYIVGTHDQHYHEKHKHVEVREKPPGRLIMCHVTCTVYMNNKTHAGNHEDHHSGKRINHQGNINIKIAHGHPIP